MSWWQSWATAHWSGPASFLAAICLLGLVKGLHYPVEGVNSLGNASFGMQVCILVGVTNTSAYQGTWLATGNSHVMVLLDKGQRRWRVEFLAQILCAQCQGFLRPLEAAVTRISPLQVSDWSCASSLRLICEHVYASWYFWDQGALILGTQHYYPNLQEGKRMWEGRHRKVAMLEVFGGNDGNVWLS